MVLGLLTLHYSRENILHSTHVILQFIGHPDVLHRHFLLDVVLLLVSVLRERLIKVGEAILLLGALLALVTTNNQVFSRWDDGEGCVRRWKIHY